MSAHAGPLREVQLVGLEALAAATTLLQRVRTAHPTIGLFEAADAQWWWRAPRSTDEVPQLFWLDDDGCPEAAVIATDWGDSIGLDPVALPDASSDWIAHVVDRGLAHAADCGFDTVDVAIDRTDDVRRAVLARHGLTAERPESTEAWMRADRRPAVSPLAAGYRLASRNDRVGRPHHMAGRGGAEIEERLRQTSLYRSDLDLVVFDGIDRLAAYGLFWFDPVTATGLVEPMRTEDDHQGRGLARHLLTTGIDRLASAGATRIKICFDPGNPAAKHLYLDVCFEPVKECVVLSRPRD
jgi:GNAT superfamily N-acetyltransferase